MQISNINPATTLYSNKKYTPAIQKAPCASPSFTGAIPKNTYKSYIEKVFQKEIRSLLPDDNKAGIDAFRKLGNFTIGEYNKLTKLDIENINELIKNYINKREKSFHYKFTEAIDYHDTAALNMKALLDKKYGEGNYVVISIGRSLSSINKCLGYKIGEKNVKQLPMSCAERYICPENWISEEDFKTLRKYLSSIGLSKSKIQTSGKQYLFMDFCDSGNSLLGAKKLLTSDKIYGNLENIRFVDFIKFLKKSKLNNFFKYNLQLMLYGSKFKKYSLVNPCVKLSDTRQSVKTLQDYTFEARVFLFKLLENEMKKYHLNTTI